MRLGSVLWLVGVFGGGLFGCKMQEEAKAPVAQESAASAKQPAGVLGTSEAEPAHFPTDAALLLSLAQFDWEVGEDGKRRPSPGPAKLLMLSPPGKAAKQGGGAEWERAVLEDPDSRVFHKAACVQIAGERRLMTIGGTDALLKLWRVEQGVWKGETLWEGTFGGKWDRLRDFEVADVNEDGRQEIVLATHDQGVIAVLERSEDGETWEAEEVFRQRETFVHEIEIGDTDGDGRLEFFATPSKPNKADVSQAGGILVFRHKPGGGYQHHWVTRFTESHAKEILVTDLNGDGRDELYAAVEASRGNSGRSVATPLQVREYVRKGRRKWEPRLVASLPGGLQSRVLIAGDPTGSGRKEIVTTTMKGGIWRLVPPRKARGSWKKVLVDAASSGFEHAANVVDVDQDGKPELYAAADDQDEVRRYFWDGQRFVRQSITALQRSDLVWSIVQCGAVVKL